MQTTIQIRVDKKLKEAAAKTLEAVGVDLSAGIKLFLNEVVTTHSLGFTPTTGEGMKLKHFEEYKKESAWTKKYGKRYTEVKELIKDALNENGIPYKGSK
jgi:addiction module RelB/DinJ family antitoxin